MFFSAGTGADTRRKKVAKLFSRACGFLDFCRVIKSVVLLSSEKPFIYFFVSIYQGDNNRIIDFISAAYSLFC